MTEYDEIVKDYWKISYGTYIVEMDGDAGLEDKFENLKTTPLHLGAFVLPNSKIITRNIFHTTNGFYTKDVYYRDTDSLYIEKQH